MMAIQMEVLNNGALPIQLNRDYVNPPVKQKLWGKTNLEWGRENCSVGIIMCIQLPSFSNPRFSNNSVCVCVSE